MREKEKNLPNSRKEKKPAMIKENPTAQRKKMIVIKKRKEKTVMIKKIQYNIIYGITEDKGNKLYTR